MRFEVVLFDLGYTLLYMEREELFAGVAEKFGAPRALPEIAEAFHVMDKRLMREFPGLLARSSDEFMPLYFGLLCDYLRIHGNIVDFLSQWMKAWKSGSLRWQTYPNVEATLERLSSMGLRLGVISNWDKSARSILQRCGILEKFETVVISSEVGVSKPDKKIFQLAVEGSGVDPSRCLYVGDNYYDDAVGASSVGMRYLIVNRYGRLGVEELIDVPIIDDISGIFAYLESSGV